MKDQSNNYSAGHQVFHNLNVDNYTRTDIHTSAITEEPNRINPMSNIIGHSILYMNKTSLSISIHFNSNQRNINKGKIWSFSSKTIIDWVKGDEVGDKACTVGTSSRMAIFFSLV